MWTKQKRRSIKMRFVLPLMTVGVLSYFSYHIYHGEYGLYSRSEVNQYIVELEEELQKLEAERIFIEKRISLLRNGHIEKDMLDEYVRRNLNFSKPNELTILIPLNEIKS
ncbi:septum formation initiator family protein [Bartonella henselae]|uniref:FtsB family cell division protein n=1 Tax=Bartonella henselae TaxID=38323 RepID=UPI0009683B56|nr:septum formation initiator family protein [Bartonella henselae]OLL53813.1 cell division protein [Bartonella henselae]OLL53915.1 cell division protein [Bartonella henselae]UJM32934.1 septum formation initiator family protein [Bartonella henselae]